MGPWTNLLCVAASAIKRWLIEGPSVCQAKEEEKKSALHPVLAFPFIILFVCVYSKAVLLTLVLGGPSSSAHFGCLLNLTHLIQFISSLVEASRAQMCVWWGKHSKCAVLGWGASRNRIDKHLSFYFLSTTFLMSKRTCTLYNCGGLKESSWREQYTVEMVKYEVERQWERWRVFANWPWYWLVLLQCSAWVLFVCYLYKDWDHQGHQYFVSEVDWPWQTHVCTVFSLH